MESLSPSICSKFQRCIHEAVVYTYSQIVLWSLAGYYLHHVECIRQGGGKQPDVSLASTVNLFEQVSVNCRRALTVSSIALCYGVYTAWSSAHILRIAGLVTIAVCSVALSNVTAVVSFLPSIDVRRFVNYASPNEMETVAIICAIPASSVGWCTICAGATLLLHVAQTSIVSQLLHSHPTTERLPTAAAYFDQQARVIPPSLPIWALAFIGSVVSLALLRLTALQKSLERICHVGNSKYDVVQSTQLVSVESNVGAQAVNT
ncbi:hypothetical protein BC629DRAFT_1546670 [Irpex lacteus]|nr:hypothetical protein BC629DRAFT_1546670 [Irpex lacteus]